MKSGWAVTPAWPVLLKFLFGHQVINFHPVGGNLNLCILQGYSTFADLVMQVVLNLIFFMKTGPGVGCFGEQIGDIIRAAQFKADEMVNFVLSG